MLIDSSELSENSVLNSDLCIVGGGAASLAICHALMHSSISIIVLDSGDLVRTKIQKKF